jgi:hypothetical protein
MLDGVLLGLRDEPQAAAVRLLYSPLLGLQHLQLLRSGPRLLPGGLLREVHPLQVHVDGLLIRSVQRIAR